MGAFAVVSAAVVFSEHLGFDEASEEFHVQELVPEPAVKAFDVGVLPRCSWLDVERRKAALLNPVLHCERDELGAVVASDELRRVSLLNANLWSRHKLTNRLRWHK